MIISTDYFDQADRAGNENLIFSSNEGNDAPTHSTEEPVPGGKIDCSTTPIEMLDAVLTHQSGTSSLQLLNPEKGYQLKETPLTGKEPKPKRELGRKRSFRFKAKGFVQRRTDKFESHYELCQILGEGGFGEVYLCKSKNSGEERAVKIIDKNKEYDEVINEYMVLRQVDHPNLIRMYEFYDTRDNFYIVQDYVKGGELFDVIETIGRLPEADTAMLMKQLLSCLKYLADEKIVHRDINLENILLEDNKDWESIKIIDFGLAKRIEDDQPLTEIVGKTYYLAPEVLEQNYGLKYDVWSSGVIAYICLSGFCPFEANSEAFIRELIMEGDVSFDDPEWNGISDEAKDFVKRLLTYEQAERPTAIEALNHPWITNAIQISSDSFRKEDSIRAQTTLSNLLSFTPASKLKQATRSYITSQLLRKEERKSIDRLFRELDTDCDGKLSMEDLQTNYKAFSDSELSDEQMRGLFENCDMSGSGFIDYSEFIIAGMKDCDLMDEAKLKAAFDNFDTEHTGYISAENLKQSLAYCRDDDEALNDEVIDSIIKQVDKTNEGLITFEDFKEIMFQNAPSTDILASSDEASSASVSEDTTTRTPELSDDGDTYTKQDKGPKVEEREGDSDGVEEEAEGEDIDEELCVGDQSEFSTDIREQVNDAPLKIETSTEARWESDKEDSEHATTRVVNSIKNESEDDVHITEKTFNGSIQDHSPIFSDNNEVVCNFERTETGSDTQQIDNTTDKDDHSSIGDDNTEDNPKIQWPLKKCFGCMIQ